MDELRYNSEGYYDPVVYEAITKIEREEREARRKAAYRPLVYICSPYAGDVEKNTFRARAFSRFAVEKKYIPIAPHLLCPQYLDEETERCRVTELRSMIATQQESSVNVDLFLAKVRKYTDVRELTPEIIREFVDHIEVYKPERISGHKVQRMRIVWNCIGEFMPPQPKKDEKTA